MARDRYVSYLRVSTGRQAVSGLGLEAQRAAVGGYVKEHGGTLAAEYVEVESGRKNDRPELAKALTHAKAIGATVLIAKLDRLARSVHFVSGLMESGGEFLAVDMPMANRFTVHILAAVAEHEREMISQRTREALAAAKRRGVQLGCPNGATALQRYIAQNGNGTGVAAAQKVLEDHARGLVPIVAAIKAGGHTSLRQIAAELNARGIRTFRGGACWHPGTVRALLARQARIGESG